MSSLKVLFVSVFRNLSFFDLFVLEETLKCVYCEGGTVNNWSEYGIKCGNTTRVVRVLIWQCYYLEVVSDL